MAVRSLIVALEARTSAFETALTRVDRRIGNFERSMARIQRTLAFAATAGGIAIATKKLFDLGSAALETQNKFDTVFGNAAGQMRKFGEQFATMAGLSRSQFQELAATAGAVTQGLGFAEAASARMAEQIVRLAGDVGSFNNLPTADVAQRITTALTGERESLKRLGIVVTEAEVQQRAFAATGKTVAAQLTQQEKATATLQIITEKAGRAVGDLARTQDSAANRAKQLRAQFTSIAEDFSRVLLPALSQMLPLIKQLADLTASWVRQLGLASLQLAEWSQPGTIQFQADLAGLSGLGGDALARKQRELQQRRVDLGVMLDVMESGQFSMSNANLEVYSRLMGNAEISTAAVRQELERVTQLLGRLGSMAAPAAANVAGGVTTAGGNVAGRVVGQIGPQQPADTYRNLNLRIGEVVSGSELLTEQMRDLTGSINWVADAAHGIPEAMNRAAISMEQFAVAAINTTAALIAQLVSGGGGGVGSFLQIAGGLLSFVNPIAGAAVAGVGTIIAAADRNDPQPVRITDIEDRAARKMRDAGPSNVTLYVVDSRGNLLGTREVLKRAERRDAIQRIG